MSTRSSGKKLALVFAGIAILMAQDDWRTKAGGKMSFEVASVKLDTGPFRPPNFALDPGDAYSTTGGRFSADRLHYIRI
jgi:hypothetical protein